MLSMRLGILVRLQLMMESFCSVEHPFSMISGRALPPEKFMARKTIMFNLRTRKRCVMQMTILFDSEVNMLNVGGLEMCLCFCT